VASPWDREGNPISVEQWAALFEDKGYQVVRQTRIGEVMISTVWLGIDHGFGYSEWPIIFETMTFGAGDEEQYRYHSEAEALEGHEQLVVQFQLLVEATK